MIMTGIILAGGKSSRMGTNKALLKIDGKAIIEILIGKMQKLFNEVVIVTNSIEEYMPFTEAEQDKGVRVIKDIVPDMGSLSGLHSGLVDSKNEYNFIIACDMPFLNEGLVRYMKNGCEDYDIVVPKINHRYEPLFAIYSRDCISFIEKQLERDNRRIIDILPLVNKRVITQDELNKFDSEALSFFNINTNADYQQGLNITPSPQS